MYLPMTTVPSRMAGMYLHGGLPNAFDNMTLYSFNNQQIPRSYHRSSDESDNDTSQGGGAYGPTQEAADSSAFRPGSAAHGLFLTPSTPDSPYLPPRMAGESHHVILAPESFGPEPVYGSAPQFPEYRPPSTVPGAFTGHTYDDLGQGFMPQLIQPTFTDPRSVTPVFPDINRPPSGPPSYGGQYSHLGPPQVPYMINPGEFKIEDLPPDEFAQSLRQSLGLRPQDPLNLWSLQNPPHGQKPVESYPELVKLAIYSSPRKMLTLQEIYEALESRFEYFRSQTGKDAAWKNSIRHMLSLKAAFEHVKRPPTEPGKGTYWKLTDRAGNKRARKRRLVPKAGKHSKSEGDSESDDDSISSHETSGHRTKSVLYGKRIPPYSHAASSSAAGPSRNLRVSTRQGSGSSGPLSGGSDSAASFGGGFIVESPTAPQYGFGPQTSRQQSFYATDPEASSSARTGLRSQTSSSSSSTRQRRGGK